VTTGLEASQTAGFEEFPVRARKIAIAALAATALLPVMPGVANAETATVTLTGGTLALSTAPFAFTNTAVTGAAQNITATAANWTVSDARGTGAAWTATISSTALTSAAGSVENSARTIAVGQMSMVNNAVTASSGSDATTNITSTPVTLTGSNQTFVASSGTNKGSYTFAPTLTLAVPANAYRSNYAGVVGGSALNPYTATLTLTIS
jgi:hypothetical protein